MVRSDLAGRGPRPGAGPS